MQSAGSFDFSSGRHYVYAMLCRDGDGPLYIKIGKSDNIGQRLSSLRSSCPIPAKWFAVVECVNHIRQRELEVGIHRKFKHRKTKGEWFKFDSDSDADKREFNDVCAQCFYDVGMGKANWTKISVAVLDAHAKQCRADFVARHKNMTAVNNAKRGAGEMRRYRHG